MSGYLASIRNFFAQGAFQYQVVVARNGRMKSFTLRPWHLAGSLVLFLLVSAGYLTATTYLFIRDDLLTERTARTAIMETTYQDRILRLRTHIDHLTSRQIVDRVSVENLVSELVRRQDSLDARHIMVSDLVNRAIDSGIRVAISSPIPSVKPQTASLAAGIDQVGGDIAIGGESQPIEDPFGVLGLRGSDDLSQPAQKKTSDAGLSPGDQAALIKVQETLDRMNNESTAALDALAVATEAEIDSILDATRGLGVRLAGANLARNSRVGGPFVAYEEGTFDARIQRVERALLNLDLLRTSAKALPIRRPIEGAEISSRFGPRLDPFLRRLAMHTGMDFKARYGTRIRSAAAGTVLTARRKGGYGKLVEIQHDSGLITRYAHLSRIMVEEGEEVIAGDVIGKVGSTGRSTGPHLHYEVRLNGDAVNPALYVIAGDRLAKTLRH